MGMAMVLIAEYIFSLRKVKSDVEISDCEGVQKLNCRP